MYTNQHVIDPFPMFSAYPFKWSQCQQNRYVTFWNMVFLCVSIHSEDL